MIDYPQTLEEAQVHKYEIGINNPQGYSYVNWHCAYEVPFMFFTGSHQCSQENGKGPAGLYCEKHAKIITQHSDKSS